jgi:uncharacterized protein (DUF2147 family)
MGMQKRAVWRLGVILSTVLGGSAAQSATIAGKWINPSKSVIIDIEPCGHLSCGTVVWASAKAKHDARKGTAHLIGTQLLTDMRQASAHEWKGQLFVPDENLRATAKLKPEGKTHLKVSGCKVMICKSQMWTKSHQTHA